MSIVACGGGPESTLLLLQIPYDGVKYARSELSSSRINASHGSLARRSASVSPEEEVD